MWKGADVQVIGVRLAWKRESCSSRQKRRPQPRVRGCFVIRKSVAIEPSHVSTLERTNENIRPMKGTRGQDGEEKKGQKDKRQYQANR